jgi:hypothetical protein
MRQYIPLSGRQLLGVIGIVVVALLMVTDTIDPDVGLTTIIGILAALGVYSGYKHRAAGDE